MVYKKILFVISLLALLSVPLSVLAAPNINEFTDKIATKSGYDKSDGSTLALSVRVGKIISIAMTLVGTIFLALTVYAGFLWMTAQGNEENVTKATNILKMSVTGLIIVLSAYSITFFVVSRATQAASTDTSTVGGSTAPQNTDITTSDFWSGFGQGFVNQAKNPSQW